MRAEHSRQLQRHRKVRNSMGFMDEVKDFLRRGQATGALLREDSDRAAAQSLLDYWATVVYRASNGNEMDGTTLAEFQEDLEPDLPPDPCPYRGLDSFAEGEEPYYFGRQGVVDECLERLEHNRLLAVVGWAGSGATSLVEAGLLPALKNGALPGSEGWRYCPTLRPDVDPQTGLARLVLTERQGTGANGCQVASGTRCPQADRARFGTVLSSEAFLQERGHLASLIAQLGEGPTILVIDGFETIFTLWGERQRQAFADNLAGLIEAEGTRHRVILVMKNEAARHIDDLASLREAFRSGEVHVPPLTTKELREAIEGPASLVGLKFDEGLVDRLLLDLHGDPAALPLLQFTLRKLWDRKRRNRVTWEAYKEIGGGRRALQVCAEAFSAELTHDQREAAKQILLCLVQPTLGPEVTLGNVPRHRLLTKGASPELTAAVLEKLLNAQLVRQTGQAADPTIALAQEALVNHWPELRGWLDDARFELRRRLRLQEAARQWFDHGKDPAGLRRGALLAEALEYPDLDAQEKEFVDASLQAEEAERRREQRRNRFKLFALALIAVLVISLLSVLALWNSWRAALAEVHAEDERKAKLETRETYHRLATANGRRVLEEGDVSTALLWFSESSEPDEEVAPEEKARGDARRQNQQLRFAAGLRQFPRLQYFWHDPSQTNYAEFSPTEDLVVVAIGDSQTPEKSGRAELRDATKGQTVLLLPHPAGEVVEYATFDPKGKLVVTLSREPRRAGGTVRIWQVKRQAKNDPPPRPVMVLPHMARVNRAAFSPDGHLLATASGEPGGKNGVSLVWDVRHRWPFPIFRVEHTGPAQYAAFSPRGTYFVAAGASREGGKAQVWKVDRMLRTPAPLPGAACLPHGLGLAGASPWGIAGAPFLWLLTPSSSFPPLEIEHKGMVNWAAFSPDDRYLVTASGEQGDETGEAQVWALEHRYRISGLGHKGGITYCAYSPDGRLVVTTSHDRTARVWEARTGRQFYSFSHGSSVFWATFHHDGRLLVTASRDRTARLWSLVTGETIVPPLNHGGTVAVGSFSPDGRWLATASPEGARVWDTLTGNPLPRVLKAGGLPRRIVCGSDSRIAITTIPTPGAKDRVQLWDVETNTELLPGKVGAITQAAYSPDKKSVITAGGKEAGSYFVHVWDAGQGKPRIEIPCHEQINYVAFSPNGRYFVTGDGDLDGDSGTARVYEAKTGKPVGQPLSHRGAVLSASFSYDPENERIITASADDKARIWKTATGEQIGKPLEHTADVLSATFSPDGTLAATASYDGTVRLWDVVTSIQKAVVKRPTPVPHVAFLPDGRSLVIASRDGNALIWEVQSNEVIMTLRTGGEILRVGARDGVVVTVSSHAVGQPLGEAARRVPVLRPEPFDPIFPSPVSQIGRVDQGAPPTRWLEVREWNISLPRWKREQLRAYTEFLSGSRYDKDSGSTVLLERNEFSRLWTDLAQYPRKPSTASALPSHSHQADECEATGQWFAAVWHLTRIIKLKAGRQGATFARRAFAHAQLGDWEKADGDYRAALKTNPKDWRAHEGMARVQLMRRKVPDAIWHYTKAIDLQPDLAERLRLHRNLAETYERNQDWDSAIEQYNKIVDADDSDWRAFAKRGYAKSVRKLWKESAEDYTQAIARQPEPKEAWLYEGRGRANHERGDWRQAAQDYTEALKLNPGNHRLRYERAQQWVNGGRREEAIKDFTAAANAYARSFNWREADRSYTEALALNRTDGSILEQRASARVKARNLTGAVDDYTEAIGIQAVPEKKAQLYRERGQVYRNLLNWDAAIGDLTAALVLVPDNWQMWEGRARLLKEVGSFPTRLSTRIAAGWGLAGQGPLHLLPCLPLLQAGPWPQVVADYSRAIDLQPEPKDGRLYAGRGSAYTRLQRLDLALRDYDEAVTRLPKDWTVLRERAQVLGRQLRRWEDALKDYAQAIEGAPDSGLLRREYGQALAELARWKEAVSSFSAATRLSPHDPLAWRELALAHLASGNEDEYRRTCEQMLDRFGKFATAATANSVAWTCVLRPGAVNDPARAVEVARRAVSQPPPNASYLNTLGAALYRASDYRGAIAQVEKAKTAPRITPAGLAILGGKEAVSVWDQLFLAMAHHGLGEEKQAKAWLEKAVSPRPEASPSPAWTEKLELQLLRHEAETTLGQARPRK
jgi:WD40 repeat protein/tetratricopeptide (TPR) repeat protein